MTFSALKGGIFFLERGERAISSFCIILAERFSFKLGFGLAFHFVREIKILKDFVLRFSCCFFFACLLHCLIVFFFFSLDIFLCVSFYEHYDKDFLDEKILKWIYF